MNCTDGVKPGSVCIFECDDFFIIDENDPNPVIIPSPHELEGDKEISCGEF